MATTATAMQVRSGVSGRVLAGAAGGLIGGVAFGAMMQGFGMLPMVAMLVGSESVAIGWLVHLSISLALGVGFGLVAVRGLDSWATGIAIGLGYGVLWWVLGALLIMPAQLGMPVLELSTMAWQSLAGHLVFGAVLAAVSVGALRGSRET